MTEESGIGGVRTVVDHQSHLASCDGAVRLHAGLEVVDHALAALVGCKKFLTAAKHEPDRALGRTRERGDVRFVVEAALTAEAAAEVGHDYAHSVVRQLKGLAHAGACVERHLCAGPDGDLVAFPLRDDSTRFDRCRVAPIGLEVTAHDMVGFGKPLLDVALRDRRERRIVAIANHDARCAVVGPVFVHERRARRKRRRHIVDDRKRRVLDDNRVDRSLRGVGVDGCDGGNDLALEAHNVACEQRAILHHRAETHIGYVVGG